MKQYKDLMQKIILEGIEKEDTFSLFGETLEFDLAEGFPLLSSRKINYKAAFGELACFLQGHTDLKEFHKRNVKFWDEDCKKDSWANSPYKVDEGDLGRIYGYQWRYGFKMDQLKELVQAIKNKPTSRRHVLITFNPGDLKMMCLPPCFVSHQFYSDGKTLNMLVHQRSADFCLGVPNDIASFALFLKLMAKETMLVPGKLKIIFGDVHIYKAHTDGVAQQVKRPAGNPCLLSLRYDASIFNFEPEMAIIDEYNPLPVIKYPFVVQN